jgi:FkbM family methyltransferase
LSPERPANEHSQDDERLHSGATWVECDVLQVSTAGQSFRVVPSHGPGFWNLVNAGAWEPDTFVVLNRMLSEGVSYVDCGAWIGPTALYAACKGARVTAFECDPVAIQRLKENLALNLDLAERVTVIDAGLSDRDGPFVLYSSSFGNSGSSVFDVVERKGQPLVFDKQVCVQGLEARRVFDEGGWLSDPNALIKIDVEGAEYRILSSLGSSIEEAACNFFISFHPFNLISKDARPDRLVRARATLAWMDQFWNYVWWSGVSGALERVDKTRELELALTQDSKALYRELTMAGKGLPGILFSRRDDLG